MDARRHADERVAAIASAIGEPARARMLFSLMDDRARTGTELAVVAGVSPSTASAHLQRLKAERLINVHIQGRHRYYSLGGADVAAAIEGLSVLAGTPRAKFVPTAPDRLRAARTCYDHMAGALGVALGDRLQKIGWLFAPARDDYDLTPAGTRALEHLGVDVAGARASRRRFAFPCLDWSERRAHVGGALGAAILKLAMRKKWVVQDLDSRALEITGPGRKEFRARFGLAL